MSALGRSPTLYGRGASLMASDIRLLGDLQGVIDLYT